MLFLKGLQIHGKSWKKISEIVKTRTVVQIRTHAQKYLIKLEKAKKVGHQGVLMMDGKGVNGEGSSEGRVKGVAADSASSSSSASSASKVSVESGLNATPAFNQSKRFTNKTLNPFVRFILHPKPQSVAGDSSSSSKPGKATGAAGAAGAAAGETRRKKNTVTPSPSPSSPASRFPMQGFNPCGGPQQPPVAALQPVALPPAGQLLGLPFMHQPPVASASQQPPQPFPAAAAAGAGAGAGGAAEACVLRELDAFKALSSSPTSRAPLQQQHSAMPIADEFGLGQHCGTPDFHALAAAAAGGLLRCDEATAHHQQQQQLQQQSQPMQQASYQAKRPRHSLAPLPPAGAAAAGAQATATAMGTATSTATVLLDSSLSSTASSSCFTFSAMQHGMPALNPLDELLQSLGESSQHHRPGSAASASSPSLGPELDDICLPGQGMHDDPMHDLAAWELAHSSHSSLSLSPASLSSWEEDAAGASCHALALEGGEKDWVQQLQQAGVHVPGA